MWAPEFFENVLGGNSVTKQFGLAAFMAGECFARMNLVDILRQRLGRRKLVTYGGALATVSCLVATMTVYFSENTQIPIATISYLFFGIGCAPLVPVAFSSSGHSSENTSAALSTVAFCTDFGSVVGPLLIGAASYILHGLHEGMLFASCLIGLTVFVGLNLPSDPEQYNMVNVNDEVKASKESVSSVSSITEQ